MMRKARQLEIGLFTAVAVSGALALLLVACNGLPATAPPTSPAANDIVAPSPEPTGAPTRTPGEAATPTPEANVVAATPTITSTPTPSPTPTPTPTPTSTPTPTATATPEGTVVRLEAPPNVSTGADFTVNVSIAAVEDFDATNYDVVFDPDLLAVVETQDGKPLVAAGEIDSTTVPVDAANEIEPGRLRIVQNVPGISGVSGTGTLATIRLRTIASGTSQLTLENGVLSSAQAQAIPAEWEGATFTVGE